MELKLYWRLIKEKFMYFKRLLLLEFRCQNKNLMVTSLVLEQDGSVTGVIVGFSVLVVGYLFYRVFFNNSVENIPVEPPVQIDIPVEIPIPIRNIPIGDVMPPDCTLSKEILVNIFEQLGYEPSLFLIKLCCYSDGLNIDNDSLRSDLEFIVRVNDTTDPVNLIIPFEEVIRSLSTLSRDECLLYSWEYREGLIGEPVVDYIDQVPIDQLPIEEISSSFLGIDWSILSSFMLFCSGPLCVVLIYEYVLNKW